MSWVKRVSLVCDSCWAVHTPCLSFEDGASVWRVMKSVGWWRVKAGDETYELCAGCYEFYLAHTEEERNRRLEQGVHMERRIVMREEKRARLNACEDEMEARDWAHAKEEKTHGE